MINTSSPADRMKRLRRVALGCAAAVCLAALPSAVSAQTLQEALVQAYQANPTLNAQRAATRATDEGVPQALSGYRPQISASADSGVIGTRRDNGIRGLGSSRVNTGTLTASAGLTVSQPLFDGFRTKNSVRAAESNVLASRETLLNTEQNVLFDGVESYMNVLRDFAILDLNRNNVELLDEERRATQERFDVGEVTRTDTALSLSRLSAARSQLSVAEANLKASRAVFRQVIGSDPARLHPSQPIDRLLPKTLPAALEIGFVEHPAARAAFHAVDVAELNVRVIQGELAPSLSVQANAGYEWNENDITPGADTYSRQAQGSVLGVLSVPIYQGGQEYSRVREAKEILGQRRLEAESVRDQVRAAVVSAWGALEGARSQIEAAQAQVDASAIALSGVREEQRVGQRTFLDVLNFQQEQLDARTTLITAQRDRVVASYALLQAIGRLNIVQLNLKVPAYDARVHYDQVRDKWIGLRTPDGR